MSTPTKKITDSDVNVGCEGQQCKPHNIRESTGVLLSQIQKHVSVSIFSGGAPYNGDRYFSAIARLSLAEILLK